MKENFPDQIYQEHLTTVYDVARQFWGRDVDRSVIPLDSINVIKQTGGKIMGFLPEFAGYPSVFFKVYFYDRGFQFEVNGLTAANTMPRVEGIDVPRTVRIIPEHKAILTERRIWQDTSTGFKRYFITSLDFNWEKIGEWLRNFHDSTVSHEKNEYFLRKKFQKLNALVDAVKPLFNSEHLEKIESIALAARNYCNTTPHEWVLSHGDFGLDNIKKSGSSLEIIDFEDCQMAPREFDLINLFTRLDYTRRFPHNRRTFENIRSRFLAGYGPDPQPSPVSDFLYLVIKLEMLESYYRRLHKKGGSLIDQLIFRIFFFHNQSDIFRWLIKDKKAGEPHA